MTKDTIDAKDSNIRVLVTHQGAWGPWYHVSEYERDDTLPSGYRFIVNHGGHYSRSRALALGLPFGRPALR